MAAIYKIKASVMRIKKKHNKNKSERERNMCNLIENSRIHNLLWVITSKPSYWNLKKRKKKYCTFFKCTIKWLTIKKNQDVFNQWSIEFLFFLSSFIWFSIQNCFYSNADNQVCILFNEYVYVCNNWKAIACELRVQLS